ncbi:MAG: hypothetical protein ACXW2I_05695 [Burkholderiales bacterium]
MKDNRTEGRFIGITVEALLHPCEIYPVPSGSGSGNGYVWEWSAVGDAAKSSCCFDMFFDCLDDARQHGYEPHFLDRNAGTNITVVPVNAKA